VFCSDGAIPIDNNVSEREMKRVVLNRKNSPFVGNPRCGRTAAILASLTSTCRRHDVDPQLYFTQLLTNLSQVANVNSPTGCQTSGSCNWQHACASCRTRPPQLRRPTIHVALTIFRPPTGFYNQSDDRETQSTGRKHNGCSKIDSRWYSP